MNLKTEIKIWILSRSKSDNMSSNGSFTPATSSALAQYPELQRYFQVKAQVAEQFPKVFADHLFSYEKANVDLTPEDIEDMAECAASLNGGSSLMSFLSYILHDLIILQKKDLIRDVLDLLTEKECTQLLWKTPASRSLSFPLIFLACLVPYEHHLISLGSSKEEIASGCLSILDLLLRKGGWCPAVGCTFDIIYDRRKMADLSLPSDFFVKLQKEMNALETSILASKDQLSPADLRRFHLYSPPEEDLSQEDLPEDLSPEDPSTDLRSRLRALLQCKRYLEQEEQCAKFGLELGFFVQMDQEIDALRVQLDDSQLLTLSDDPLVRELEVLESLHIAQDFYLDKTCTTVRFSDLEDFLKLGNSLIFDIGVCNTLHSCGTNSALQTEDFYESAIFSFTSVLPWTDFRKYLRY